MDYTDYCSGRLISQLATGTTTGVTVQANKINGAYVTFPTGACKLILKRETETDTYVEKILIAAGSSQTAGGVVTLGTLTRNISLTDGTDTTGSAATITWAPGTLVYISWDTTDAEQTAKKNEANTFSAAQTLSGTNALNLHSSATQVWKDGSGNLSFKDASNGTKTLTQLSAQSGADEKFKISSNDTTQDYAVNKITGGDGITVTETNDGGNETLDIDIELATNPGLEISGGKLQAKVKANSGLTLDSNGLSIATQTSAGYVLTDNGASTAPTFQAPTMTCKTVLVNITASSALSNPTSATAFDQGTYVITANDLVASIAYEFDVYGAVTFGTNGELYVSSMLGSTALAMPNVAGTGTKSWNMKGRLIGTTTAGVSSAVLSQCTLTIGDGSTTATGIKLDSDDVATNGALTLQFGAYFGTSNAGNSVTLTTATIKKIATAAFR